MFKNDATGLELFLGHFTDTVVMIALRELLNVGKWSEIQSWCNLA